MQRSPIPISSAQGLSATRSWPDGRSEKVPEDTSPPSGARAPLEVLRQHAASGRAELDPLLAKVTESARALTGASGAALALWSHGVVICRARSGDPAPELGAKLSPDSGISGECLRTAQPVGCEDTTTDPRVDLEVCQELGLRSLLAVPLVGRSGVIGILEVFSTQPRAFATTDTELLQQLAEIVVTGREGTADMAPTAKAVPAVTSAALKPVDEAPVVTVAPPVAAHSLLTALSEGPVRSVKGAMAWLLQEEGQRARLAGLGLLAAVVLAALGWVLVRTDTPEGSRGAPNAQPVVAAVAAPISNPTDSSSVEGTIRLVPNSGTKPDPRHGAGIEMTAGNVVRRASQLQPTPSPHQTETANPGGVLPQPSSEEPPSPSEVASVEPNSTESLHSVAAVPAALPSSSPPVSQGVVAGVLTRKVMPIYPAEAIRQRLRDTVVLDYVIDEEGRVSDIKVVSGSPLFAKAAQDAVSQWRYRPFQLNHKPIAMHTTINIKFNAP